MRTNNNTANSPAAQSTMSDLNRVFGTVLSTSGLLAAFSPLAFHMMMTFYLLLIISAIVVGKGAKSPSLMTFVLIWHLAAIPIWILRCVAVRVCKKPLGMLICFVSVATLFFILQPHLITAVTNIGGWIKQALAEITSF